MPKTGYILGDIDPKIARSDPGTNVFMPPYQCYCEERIPEIYTEEECRNEDGTVAMRKFDLVRQIFVD